MKPFTILIDTREQQPFSFEAVNVDSIQCEFRCLGNNAGDYSIDGFAGQCNIERKSLEDAHGTILGWGARRENFVKEMEFLSSIECGAIVIETSFEQLLAEAPEWGAKSEKENRKILFRQVLAWQQDYRVPWVFAGTRELAEIATYRILERFWEKRVKPIRSPKLKEARNLLKEL